MASGKYNSEAARLARGARANTRIEWFGDRIASGVKTTMRARVLFAGQAVRDQIVINISRPVKKKSATQVSDRSKPGEFPKADTTRLMKDIFYKVIAGTKVQVGTSLDYGLFLEVFMDRSYILRTFNEMKPQLERILGTNYKVRFRK